jgi:serine/threonine-protein kinase
MTESPTTIGRYHVVRLIAHGGMGSLYLARDPAIDRLIAIKLLREGFEDDGLRERFAREARATGRLRHPNIVTVFDIGEHDSRPFIAMEYVPGETLAHLIRRRAALSLVEKLAILEDLCAALHYAHGQGIVHRDIKPANVMLEDASGLVKVLDFGIAHAGESGLTNAGEMVGTLNYMSPEQLTGEGVDHRSDVYAVGVLAYELFTYTKAFPGTLQDGALFRILNHGPDPLEYIVPDIDPAIAPIVEAAMAKDPAERYQDMMGMARDLADVRGQLIESGAGTVFPAVTLDAEAETMAGPVEGSSSAQSPTPTPLNSFRERPISGTRESGRVARGTSPSALRSRVPATGARRVEASPGAGPASVPRRKMFVILGAVAAALILVVIGIWDMSSRSAGGPADRLIPPPEAAPPAEAPASSAPASPSIPPKAAGDADAGRRALDEQLRSIGATARRQIAAGERQQALDTLAAGIVLDASDPALRALIDDMARGARTESTRAQAAASTLGVSEELSPDFRDARAREREADALDRSGARVPAIRAYWTAAGLYERAARARRQAEAPPTPPPASRPDVEKPDAPLRPERETFVPPPVPTSTMAIEKPPSPPPVVPEPQPAPTNQTAPDTRAADMAAIQDTLERYALAYRSRDAGAVGKVVPSLGAAQLRTLERDFSNLRSYSVTITNERIVVDGATATVACEVVRSFTTTTGVTGGNTVDTVFTLKKTGGTWIIEKIASR